ncbi:hypothetical protein M569_13613, partial [Genlisea aurea]
MKDEGATKRWKAKKFRTECRILEKLPMTIKRKRYQMPSAIQQEQVPKNLQKRPFPKKLWY